MHERIKKLRKALDLTQQEFADRIQISRGALATYEIGRNEPIDAVISLICREFNVSETWLRTGEGEMFTPAPSGALDALAREYDLSPGMYILIKRLLALKPENQRAAVDFAVKLAEDLNSVPAASDTSGQDRAELEKEADAFAAMAREQYLSEKIREKQARSANGSGAG